MLADFEDVLDKLEVASRNGEKAMSFCPAHNDRNNPSLSLQLFSKRMNLSEQGALSFQQLATKELIAEC